jgi:pimeloyl-ACP methyl ester carboxylesterase
MARCTWLLLVIWGAASSCHQDRPSESTMTKTTERPARDPRVPAKTKVRPFSEVVPHDREIHGARVHFLSAGKASAPAVLLLHGARFSSRTWHELGTLELLAKSGLRAVAVDLPGYGASEQSSREPREFLPALLDALELDKPVIVSPSMSGRFAYRLLVSSPERVGGFVAVAPAQTPEFAPKLAGASFPVLVVWGEKDTVFSPSQADLLVGSVPGSRKLILEGARHPSYLDQPEAFHDALVAFTKEVSGPPAP